MQLSANTAHPGPRDRFVEMVFPDLINYCGTLFGGDALKLTGEAALFAAERRARCNVVIATSDNVEIHRGRDDRDCRRVTRESRSSMTASVEMIRENLASGRRDVVTRGNFEMVAVNEHGRPIAITEQFSRSETSTDLKQEPITVKQHTVRTYKSAEALARRPACMEDCRGRLRSGRGRFRCG